MTTSTSDRRKATLLPRACWSVLGILWILTVAVGFHSLWTYELTPGEDASAPVTWPKASTIHRSTTQATLLFFAHPHCPCTRASLNELSVLLSALYGQLDTYVLLLTPTTQERAWADTDLRHSATAMPGVRIIEDVDGREAQLFRGTTSGYVLLYDVDGRLRFSGGITAARGHVGDNVGRQALMALVRTGTAATPHTSVFGCPLFYHNEKE